MKFSENWLRQWVNTDIDSQALAEALTMLGLEVDEVQSAASDFQGVVVGEVVDADQHPDADRLKVCQVVIQPNNHPVQIVCGGANVRKGLKVPVATIGAALGDFTIKKAKLRGAESNGMICSESELGLAETSDGIMELSEDAPVGVDIREYLSLDDNTIDIDLTPNRGDCASLIGVARDLAAGIHQKLKVPKVEPVKATHKETINITIHDPKACPRYVGRVIKNIQPGVVSPVWLKEILRRSGIRSIHPVVDLTNYVMLEFGQPMHAFDLKKIVGGINVRRANKGEHLELLDGEKITLDDDSLVIADDEIPMALAGVMGGVDSAVTLDTRDILLESAFFEPIGIRQAAQRFQMSTDSSYRFERGVDFSSKDTSPKKVVTAQVRAIERMTQLLLEIVGGEPGPLIDICHPEYLPIRDPIHLRRERVEKILGIVIDDKEIIDYLTHLEMDVKKQKDGWQVTPANHRFDIEQEVDLIEELARMHGYNNIENQSPTIKLSCVASSEIVLTKHRISQFFVDRGYTEIRSYSFVDPKLETLINPTMTAKPLLNPISSEMAVMRTSLLPGLLQTLSYNVARQQPRVKLFEIGMVFQQHNDSLDQAVHLGGVIFGDQLPEQWGSESRPADFYDLKADVMQLFKLSRNTERFEFVANAHPALHPAQSAEIKFDGKHTGWFGKLHPNLQSKLDIRGDTFCFDLNLAMIVNKRLPEYQPVSKFPEIRRDIAVVVDERLAVQEIMDAIRTLDKKLLQHLEIFDIYSGTGVEEGKKSVAIAMTFQLVDRTLTDMEVNELVAKITSNLNEQFDATLR